MILNNNEWQESLKVGDNVFFSMNRVDYFEGIVKRTTKRYIIVVDDKNKEIRFSRDGGISRISNWRSWHLIQPTPEIQQRVVRNRILKDTEKKCEQLSQQLQIFYIDQDIEIYEEELEKINRQLDIYLQLITKPE